MNRFLTFALIVAGVVGTSGPLPAALIANGNFESVSGDPLKFDAWIYGSANRARVQGDSVISGNYSAEIIAGSGYNNNLYQLLSEPVSSFIYDMDFAVFPIAGDRSMNTLVYTDTGAIAFNMRVGTNNRLEAVRPLGAGWQWVDLGLPGVQTTVDVGTKGQWGDGEDIQINQLRVVGYFGAADPYYNVTLNGVTANNVQVFQSVLPANAKAGRLQLQSGSSTSHKNWLADNVMFVPEPSSAGLLAVALLFGLAVRRRRRDR